MRKVRSHRPAGVSARAEKNGADTPRLLDKFKSTYLETAVKDSTRRNYETCFRVHVLPVLGQRRLDEIDRSQVKELIASLVKKQLARATIGITIRDLCTFFNHAKEDGLIQENPATRMGKF